MLTKSPPRRRNGAAVLSYYLVLVLNTIGITNAFDQTLINGLLQIFNWIISTVFGAMMVDRVGRRTLFLVATSGMLVSYMIWTGLSAHFVTSGDAAAGRAVVAFIFIFYFFYDIAWTVSDAPKSLYSLRWNTCN